MAQLTKLYQDLPQEIPKEIPQEYQRERPRLAQQNSSSNNERGIERQKQYRKRILQPLKDKSLEHFDDIRNKRRPRPRRFCMSKPRPTRLSKRRVQMVKWSNGRLKNNNNAKLNLFAYSIHIIVFVL